MRPSLADLPPPPPGRSGWPWTEAPCGASPGPGTAPRVTLVTPSFNQGAFIEETIRSVLLQGYPDLEYIVMDGGSTDETVAILAKYSAWIDHWESTPDRGQSHAVNKGLSLATGDWFNWLNSDDILAPGALTALTTAAGPSTTVVSGVTANLRGDEVFSRYAAHVDAAWPDSLFSLRVNQPGSLLRLPAVRTAGGLRDDLHLVMDLDLWLRLLRRDGLSAFTQVDRDVATYRYHDASKTCSSDDAFALEEFAILADLAQAAGFAAPRGLRALRARCPAAQRGEVVTELDRDAVRRAWTDRLLVTDSLLFRALRKSMPADAARLMAFGELMDELAPALPRKALARAWIQAMEIEGRTTASAAWQALRLSPRPATARALLRLALNR